ncbi:hypothetical protein JCM8547_009226, partial [Rhodosporidiobolus lusitaniae]
MPVRPLLIELTSQIVDEIRESCGDGNNLDVRTLRSHGRSCALVWKAWRPLGTAMVWYKVVLDSVEAIRPAVEHFKQYGHLPNLVKEMELLDDPGDCDPEDIEIDAGVPADLEYLRTHCKSLILFQQSEDLSVPSGWIIAHLPTVLSLRGFELSAVFGRLNPAPVLTALASLKSLAHLVLATSMMIPDNLDWS